MIGVAPYRGDVIDGGRALIQSASGGVFCEAGVEVQVAGLGDDDKCGRLARGRGAGATVRRGVAVRTSSNAGYREGRRSCR